MKILRVIASMEPSSGGPCQGIRNSVPELEKLGVQNEVVCLDEPNAAFLGKDEFLIHALGSAKGPWSYSKALVPWLINNFSRFDVVLVHGLWLYPSFAVRKAINLYKNKQQGISKQIGTKVPQFFVMPHGMLDPYFQKAPGRKLKALRNQIYWKFIESKVVNEANGVLFTCEGELQLARVPFQPYLPKKEVNVGYGIPKPPDYTALMQKAFLEKCPELKNRPYILFLSRIHEKKGIDILIKAYSRVLSEKAISKPELTGIDITNSNYEEEDLENRQLPVLVIAGPGLETAYGEKMRELATDLTGEDNIRVVFTGMLTGDAKWGAFYGCEAFILPSHQENFGIAVVEALACNKPVLISNQVNIWQEIQTAGGGLIANDTAEGTVKLLKLWQILSEEEKQVMSSKAKDCYENFFAIKPHALRLLKAVSQA